MANFTTFRAAAFALLPLLLGACCANNVCDCPGEDTADAIRIVFDSKFKDTDLDTLVLVRYLRYDKAKPPVPLPKPESIVLTRTTAQAFAPLVINNSTPFGRLGSARLDTFNYVLRYYPGSKPKLRPSKLALIIDQVKLSGSFEGNGCCTCYTNSRKLALSRTDSTKTATFTNLNSVEALVAQPTP